MPSGGARPGAGRPVGGKASPEALSSIRAKIKTNSIIQRLENFILGEVEMTPAQVTAALGLLRKVMPDLSAAEIKSEAVVQFVARIPNKAADTTAWQKQHAPQQTTIQ